MSLHAFPVLKCKQAMHCAWLPTLLAEQYARNMFASPYVYSSTFLHRMCRMALWHSSRTEAVAYMAVHWMGFEASVFGGTVCHAAFAVRITRREKSSDGCLASTGSTWSASIAGFYLPQTIRDQWPARCVIHHC
jgi:hypothetical protein